MYFGVVLAITYDSYLFFPFDIRQGKWQNQIDFSMIHSIHFRKTLVCWLVEYPVDLMSALASMKVFLMLGSIVIATLKF